MPSISQTISELLSDDLGIEQKYINAKFIRKFRAKMEKVLLENGSSIENGVIKNNIDPNEWKKMCKKFAEETLYEIERE